MTTLEPPYEEWRALLSANRELSHRVRERFGSEVARAVREDLVRLARVYTERLIAIAEEVGVRCGPLSTLGADDTIVMAGHQPVIYHAGLLFKNTTLNRFASESNALAINIVVDTDEGDAGMLTWPTLSPKGVTTSATSIKAGSGVYRGQVVGDTAVVQSAFSDMESALSALGLEKAKAGAERAQALYTALAGKPLAIANSIVRAVMEPHRSYLELPFSELLQAPSVRSIVSGWVSDYANFVPLYNRVLEQHRAERKIKNPANPFPNMGVRDGAFELPFWRIDSAGVRSPLIVGPGREIPSGSHDLLAPRGSIVTLLLRSLCSDLFIHGRGGAKYDPFVDALATAYLDIELPRFTVASETRYLFPDHVKAFDQSADLKARYKEIVSHTESFLECGLFTPSEVSHLRGLIAERPQLLESLKGAASSEERSTTAHKLNALNRSLREFLDASSLSQTLNVLDTDPAVVATWKNREFPCFLVESLP